MSQQLTLRFQAKRPTGEFESHLLAKGYELFESLKQDLGTQNFLSSPMTSNQRDLGEAVEEELGDFFSAPHLAEIVAAYRRYFEDREDDRFNFGDARYALGKDLATELRHMEAELRRSGAAKARFVIR